ncbi:MAG TPA: TonB-dependent receptor [Flavisolibacter sp.]|nr:TonB-dependent receptor [Flavisolibacter sp.]
MNAITSIGTRFILLCIPVFGMAQEKDINLDPVTITSSISAERTSKTGRNIYVIKGEQFYNLPVNSIDELLRYLPGIEIQSRGAMGSQSDIVLRGGTFQQVLVIMDGVRLNDPNTGHFSSYFPVIPSEIERIEILKGASSAIYGSEAVGGVINIITKSFAAKSDTHYRNSIAQLSSGAFGLLNASAGYYNNNGKTAIGFGLLTNNATGQQQRGIKGYFHNNTATISLSHFFNDNWQLSLRSSYDNRKFAAQNFYTNFVSDTAEEKVSTTWNQVQLTHHSQKNTQRLNAGYKFLNDNYSFNPHSIHNQNKSELYQVGITNECKIRPQATIVYGGQYLNKQIASNDRGNHALGQVGLFVLANQKIGNYFSVSPALRMEWVENAGWELLPQMNVSYKKELFQLRGSVGKTMRDADFTERFNNYNKTIVSSGKIGNPFLLPERSFSYEGGVDLYPANSIKLSFTYFQRKQTKLIDYVLTPYNEMPRKENLIPTGSYYLAKNIAKVNTRGVEGELQFAKTINPSQELFLTVGSLWLHSSESDTVPSLYLSSHARYLVNFTTQYSIRKFSISFSGIYKDRQPQGDAPPAITKLTNNYFLLNTRAEYFIKNKTLSVFAQVDNVFNKNYSDLLGAPMPGRWIMGGIKITLSK